MYELYIIFTCIHSVLQVLRGLSYLREKHQIMHRGKYLSAEYFLGVYSKSLSKKNIQIWIDDELYSLGN